MSFLDDNPELRENYLAVCADFGVEPYTDNAPEYIALIGRERPNEAEFAYFRKLHGLTNVTPHGRTP